MVERNDREAETAANTPHNTAGRPIVVGVGASSGSVASIERFFSKFAPNPDGSIVFAIQHREALDVSRVRDALRKVDGVDISDIEDGTAVEGGKIYLCAPDVITTLKDNRFIVRPA